jgi:transposase InsO family protein
MQVFKLHKSINRLKKVVLPEENLSDLIFEIKEKLKIWDKLKRHKVPEADISRIVGISRSSFYRYKKSVSLYGFKGLERMSKRPKVFRKSAIPESTISLILKLRNENPTYGKAKIVVLLRRDHGIGISESSVGRVISRLISQGKIKRSVSSFKVKRKRKFTSHAKRWKYGMKAARPGEMIQIDHMSVTKNAISMKHFQAWDPTTRVIIADIVSNATSAAAAKFLKKIIREMPFAVKSVQVDGGSEFMADFEKACLELEIPLYVLPPSRPQYNGGVERGNRIFREEFYARNIIAESIGAFKGELQKANQKYNDYRPHFSLKGLTPFEYTAQILAA